MRNELLLLFVHREREELSAVCVFSLSDIIKVMDGPFKELKKTGEGWNPVPTPRPGQALSFTIPYQSINLLYNASFNVLNVYLLPSTLFFSV